MNYIVKLTDQYFNREDSMNIFWRVFPNSAYANSQPQLPDSVFHFEVRTVVDNVINFLNEKNHCYSYDPYAYYFGEYESDEATAPFFVPANKIMFDLNDRHKEFMLKSDFFQLCLQFIYKALEAMDVFKLKAKGIVDDAWEQEMRALIPKIEEKIKEVIEKYGDSEE